MVKSIMVPLDGSEFSREALRTASELATALQAELLLVQVVDSASYPYLYSDPSTWKDPEQELSGVRAGLQGLADELKILGINVRVEAVVGSPATTIARIAEDEGVSMIVMATHGRGGLARLVVGSVAEAVLQRVHLPIVMIRPESLRHSAAGA
jgi:nucleotide-binding universal stress UspA family protein